MALLTERRPVENVVEERELSQYEIERNKPMPDFKHSIVQTNLLFRLGLLYNNYFSILPELNITMPTGRDAVPDVCIYPKMDIDFSNDIESMAEMPLTIIEIISPPQTEEKLVSNSKRYFDAGVKSCWIVLPSMKAIYVYSQIGKYQFFNDEMTLIDKLTGIELPLNEVFS
jgi:Uma2 family endonuclease